MKYKYCVVLKCSGKGIECYNIEFESEASAMDAEEVLHEAMRSLKEDGSCIISQSVFTDFKIYPVEHKPADKEVSHNMTKDEIFNLYKLSVGSRMNE